jgi:bacterioferritin-associated ferredoxin
LTRDPAVYICLCNAITEQQIVEAAELGARSSADLAHGLGVGLGCGRCTSCAKTLLVETITRIASAVPDCGRSGQGAAL